jgi:DNA-binding beta-propeller fold protein YncE
MKKQIILFMLVLVLGMVRLAFAGEPIGVFANCNTNCIQLINPATQEVSPSFLKGSLGSYGGGLFDVEITPDGKTAIVSNFGDSKIYFIDISCGFSAQPTLLGRTNVGIFAEDLAVTPNGKYVLVTDGGFTSRIAVVDIAGRYLVNHPNFGTVYSNAIAITPDGQTVVTSDYHKQKINLFTFHSDGTLILIKSKNIAPYGPVNVTISPDGKTVIVANANGPRAPFYRLIPDELVYNGYVTLKRGQSCVFSRDGANAYYLSNPFFTWVYELNVTGPGQVSYSGIRIRVFPKRGTSQLLGVDTIAIDPSGNYLYVTNPCVSGGKKRISIIDLTINEKLDPIQANGIPLGIKFATIAD